MKLLIDMNLSPRWVDFLASAGVEAKHWSKIGARSTPDANVMTYAQANGYVLMTYDLDFNATIAATQLGKPSVLLVSAADPNPDVVGAYVVTALQQSEQELEKGSMIAIDPARKRMGVLSLPNEAV